MGLCILHPKTGHITCYRTGQLTYSPHALAQLKALNPRAAIMLTRGADGAELHAGRQLLRQASPTVEIVDTVGAGDASIGGLLFSLMNRPGADWTTHLRYAVAAGTAACMHAGASPPALPAVEAVLAQMGL